MKKFKIIAFILVALFVLLELFVLNNDTLDTKVSREPIVSVSTFALYDITKHIAADSVKVVTMIPFGTDPHSFEPTPKLMAQIEKSSVVFLSGAGLEPWVDKMQFHTKVVMMSQFVKLRKIGDNEFEFHQHHDEQCVHNRVDPHYWLDFSNMQKMTNVITQELIELLPKNRTIYLANRDKYLHMLQKLDASYTKYLSSCRINTLIVNHNSIGYLARNYHFKAESLSGLSPETEPSPNDIKRIHQEIVKDGLTTIFFENFVSDKVIKTIADDTKVNVAVFQSLGNITADDAKAGMTYESAMYNNLQKISKALMCD